MGIWIPEFTFAESVWIKEYRKDMEITIIPGLKKVNLAIPSVIVKVLCQQMDFTQFPFDNHKCHLILKSTSTEVIFVHDEDPQFIERCTSGEYDFTLKKMNQSTVEEIDGSIFSRIGLQIYMERKSSLYLYLLYLPSGMIVMLAITK